MFLVVADQLSLLRLEADQTVRALEAFVQVIFQAEYVLIASYDNSYERRMQPVPWTLDPNSSTN